MPAERELASPLTGRICFHLAENRQTEDPAESEHPFAFLATWTPGPDASGEERHRPLANVIRERVEAGRRDLPVLLEPVRESARRCPRIAELLESGELFQPLAWTAAEAYAFLALVPTLEDAGLTVRIPEWGPAPPRLQLDVELGTTGAQPLTAGVLLSFSSELALDGEPLSDEERAAALAASAGLMFLKGRWVEVDPDALQSVMARWSEAERSAGGAVTLQEGLRLLAGAGPIGRGPKKSKASGDDDEEDLRPWSTVRASGVLAERLESMLRRGARARPPRALKARLRGYQREGLRWLRLVTDLGLGACLADDMGLGKTIQVIALILARRPRRAAARRPSLVIVPASVLGNWERELARFAPSLSVRRLHASGGLIGEDLAAARRDPAAFAEGVDVLLTTYAMVRRAPGLADSTWSLLVLDEAQAIKNPEAARTRAIAKIPADGRVALTGTPVENRVGDLWSIFDVISPGLLGTRDEFASFLEAVRDREDRYAPLRRLVRPFILRRLKTDPGIAPELPEKTEMTTDCLLTRSQAALYEQSVDELKTVLRTATGMKRRGAILAFLTRFKQICNHPDLWTGGGGFAVRESGKLKRLVEISEELAARDERLLVFTQYRMMTGPLAEALREVFGRPGLVLHGGTPVARRVDLIDDFQRPDGPPFFVLSLKAGGTGLNLTAAQHVVHFDRWWNPAVENQATDRAYRIGQHRAVFVHKFVTRGTIEERIAAMIDSKLELAEEILSGEAGPRLTELDDRELLELVQLDLSQVAG